MDRLQLQIDKIAGIFRDKYGHIPEAIVRAPGRVALIGGHVDFMHGFVMPAAIDREVLIAASGQEGRTATVYASNYDKFTSIELDHIERSHTEIWSNYVRGIFDQLQKAGYHVPGMKLAINGSVPIGGGISSSAAIGVSTALSALTLSGESIPGPELALICQRSENEFIGVKSGVMDQFISILGKAGNTMILDCRSLSYELIPLPKDTSIVVCDSKKPRHLQTSAYNQRRAECDEAVRILQQCISGVKNLRDVSMVDIDLFADRLPEGALKRARHVVGEILRVQLAAEALKAGDDEAFGQFMNESHASSRDLYESSIPELNWLQESATQVEGCLGSRLTGAGFGGFTVSLVRDGAVEEFKRKVTADYLSKAGFEPDIMVMHASDGAGRVL